MGEGDLRDRVQRPMERFAVWEDGSAVSVGKQPGHSSADSSAQGPPRLQSRGRPGCIVTGGLTREGAPSTLTEAVGRVHFLAGV